MLKIKTNILTTGQLKKKSKFDEQYLLSQFIKNH
jgi:hypothetical protein